MKLFTSGRYAAVASTAALVAALGGTSYAAAQISGGDIKDGSISTSDLARSAQTTVKQIHNDTYTALDSSTKTVLSMNLKPGNYLLLGKVNIYANAGGYGECWLTGPAGHTLDYGYYYDSGNGGDGVIVDPAIVRVKNTGTVQLNCMGSSAYADEKKLDGHLGGVGHQPDRRERRQGGSAGRDRAEGLSAGIGTTQDARRLRPPGWSRRAVWTCGEAVRKP